MAFTGAPIQIDAGTLSLCMGRTAVLLDALTIFFLAAGTLLLLINIWDHPSKIILTKVDESDDARTLER